MVHIGSMGSYSRFSRHSHNWDTGMNRNLIKAGTSFHLAVDSRVASLPGSPSEGDAVMLTGDGSINVFLEGEWYTMSPTIGVSCYVSSEECVYLYVPGISTPEWQLFYDLNADHPAIERNLSFFQPGLVRPSATMFHFIPTMEFKLPAGAPNSFATLDVAPSGGNLVLTITATSSGGTGTVTFADGSTTGVFSIPSDIVVLPADFETMYSTPQELTITTPASTYNAEGLSLSLKGEIRAIDEG